MAYDDKNSSPDSRRNIADAWIEDIVFQSLKNLNGYESLARCGCQSLKEYVSLYPNLANQPDFFSYLQLKNVELFLNELKLLLPNIKGFLTIQQYDQLSFRINKCQQIFEERSISSDGTPMKIINISTSIRYKQTTLELTGSFKILVNSLSKIRAEIIEYLNPILIQLSKTEVESSGI